MTRQSYQQGYVSDPIRTRRGLVFRIRYRLRTADGKWKHKSETLENLSGKKAARAVLDERIRESQNRPIETTDFTVQHVVDALWRPYLDRKQVKPSTKRSYDCELRVHILPALGPMRINEVAPCTSRSYCSRDWQADRLPRRFAIWSDFCKASSRWPWTTISFRGRLFATGTSRV